MGVCVNMDKRVLWSMRDFLLRDQNEHAAFLFAEICNENARTVFIIKDYYPILNKVSENSPYGFSLDENAQSRIIKRACDTGFSLVEVHSHPLTKKGTAFSSYDLQGLSEFVRYVWWRLKRRPYLALVFGQTDYDALVWRRSPSYPERLDGIIVGNDLLLPTNKTVLRGLNINKTYGRRSKV